MRDPAPRLMTRTCWLLCLVLAARTAAIAQTTRPDEAEPEAPATQPAPATPEPSGLLAGPPVKPEAAENDTSMLSGARRDRPRFELPPRRWLQMVRELDLSPAEREVVGAILQEYNTVARKFRREHGRELDAAREQARAARDEGRRSPELLDRLRRLERQRPKIEEYQQRVWEELSEANREALRAAVQQARQRDAQRRRRPAAEMMTDADVTSDARRAEEQGLDRAARRRLRFLRSRQVEDE